MNRPIVIATACFLRRDGKTLFVDYTETKHPIHSGKYSPPGGRLESWEDIEKCARREVREETGILSKDLIYRGGVSFLNEKRTINGKPMEKDFYVHFYDCYNFDDKNAKAEEGRLVWVENKDVLGLPLHEGDRIIWKEWLSEFREFNGWIKHEGERLVNYALESFKPFN